MKNTMNYRFKILFIFLWILLSINSMGQNNPANNDTLTLLLDNSKTSNKKLFLVFGWEGCGWCRVYDKYHKDSVVNEVLDKYFLISKVDIQKSEEGARLYKKYGKQGTPFWVVFNLNGEFLIDSNNGNVNIGYPAEDHELAYYAQAIKIAVPLISDEEIKTLVNKLKEYRNRKN